MADAAGSSFSAVGYVDVMEVPVAIAESGVDRRVGETKQVLFMAAETEVVDPRGVGDIESSRVGTFQQTEIVGAVGVVTAGATPESYGAVQVFLPFQFFPDVLQGSQLFIPVATQAEFLFLFGQQFFYVCGMGRMTASAPPCLGERFMKVLYLGELILECLVTLEAEIGHFVFREVRQVRTVRFVTGHAT